MSPLPQRREPQYISAKNPPGPLSKRSYFNGPLAIMMSSPLTKGECVLQSQKKIRRDATGWGDALKVTRWVCKCIREFLANNPSFYSGLMCVLWDEPQLKRPENAARGFRVSGTRRIEEKP